MNYTSKETALREYKEAKKNYLENMTTETKINETINQIEFTNKAIELINLSYDIKDKSIEKAKALITLLNYNECIQLFATCEDIPVTLINMLTHDEILTRVTKCQTIPMLIRKSLYERMELLHKLAKE